MKFSKMIKNLLSLIGLLLLMTAASFSQTVNINDARSIAKNHLLTANISTLKSARLKRENIQFKVAKTEVENKDTLFYILNDSVNNVFVIVSADQRAWPVLGYSMRGTFDEKKQPDAFRVWMEERGKEIAYIKANNLKADEQTTEKWDQLKSATVSTQSNGVEPLIKTIWNQAPYYNDLCPIIDGVRAPTGCVATAMAQIMKYWNYPTNGVGSHSYERPNSLYGPISADFGSTTYQWAQMPNELTGSNDAIATLMYHFGVASDMWYCNIGSSPSSDETIALKKYFDYSSGAEHISSDDYTKSDWADILRSELDLARPIYYSKVADPGHAFVCDGYQDSDYFHFNWGWGGIADGYYFIGNLNPLGNDFTGGGALIKITPNRLPDGYHGIFLSNNSITLGSNEGYSPAINVTVASSANWTAISDQSWLSVNLSSGLAGTSTLTLTSTENNTSSNRTAIVTISAEGYPKQYFTVKQFHVVETVAGNLQDVIASELATTTNLTIKGTIDARDFKNIRDKMPLLSKLDLTNASIVEYTGIEGTLGNKSIVYPANTIPDFAFHVPESSPWQSKTILKSIQLPRNLKTIGNAAFFNCRGINSVILPSTVTKIGSDAFYNCRKLATITFSSALTSIGNNAFFWCDHLTQTTIPATVSYIGVSAFANIKGQITVDPNNPNYSSAEGVLYNKNKTSLMQCPTSITGSFIVPPTVKTIESAAFLGDIYLTAITLPSTLNSIEVIAFSACTRLKTISLPASIKLIGAFAFENCWNVDTIISKSKIPIDLANSPGVFNNLKKDIVILKVPAGSKAAYKAADQWKDFINIVEMPNQSPTANAGADQTVNEGSIVTLDGTSSGDPDGQTLTYTWTAPAGITLSSASSAKPTFVAPEVLIDQIYTFILVVSDGIVSSQMDQITLTVKQINKAPIANAGNDQAIDEGSLVSLDGSASSDPEGSSITYLWTAPAGITLSSASSAKPTFTATEVLANKTYTFSLIVNDGTASSASDQIVVIVRQVNKVPNANAGSDQTVNEGSIVTLDGTSSVDPDGQTLTYLWTAPTGISLGSATSAKPTFVAPEVLVSQSYTFSLIVSDGTASSASDQIVVAVRQVNKVPLANAGLDQSIDEGTLVSLDGSASSDPDNNTITYNWTAPSGITLNSTTSVEPTFIAPEVNADTKFSFTLVVNDGISNSQTDQVVITILQVIKVGIDLLESPELKIFPNPTSGLTKIEVPGGKGQSVKVSINNIQGKEIFRESNFADNYLIDFTPFEDGVYLMKIKIEDKVYSAKVIHRR